MLDAMENPYLVLHREFKRGGAELLISSGQACVVFGIAAFSKAGDWIIRENEKSCTAVLSVLDTKRATYRLGTPLHPDWLAQGLTSHFEFRARGGYRARVDFCSRPPRVPDVSRLWDMAIHEGGVDLVDVESLIRIKQTRRLRDYSIIGALAEAAGFNEDMAEIALEHLQDYDSLVRAVERWPEEARACRRPAVRRLSSRAPRAEVVSALAVEQDEKMQADRRRVDDLRRSLGEFPKAFHQLRDRWRETDTTLREQHHELIEISRYLLEERR